ncbi:DEAD/DEAH box helicase [Roseomonas sp. NAR14]|uniref:DEAD/DEAH box helicase n=1 Tax=Roseomonas acroporae TaxID=2937791 RepID=A0A9X2BU77_9PROT|nr:DEAD/DEAH box helicase [Roseomonas acroporae]MCK8785202.1 DEAD/DEAH box helicase [Roseomonas acroporae]
MPFPALDPALLAALTERGYAEPTPVQAAVLEAETDPDRQGRDLLVSAQTGSGKTVAYGLALAPALLAEPGRLPPAATPLALVIAPTRELALQVRDELAWLYARAGGRVVACVGGTDPVAERRQLQHGAQIVVGTPGRLRDHLERGNLRPAAMRAVVLDEADEMLDLGFREELEAILDEVPAERRTLLFSATVPPGIAKLAGQYQKDALRLSVGAGGGRHGDIEYRAMPVAPRETERAVVNVLRHVDARLAMVFCTTRAAVARLHGNLLERGFSAVALSGELSQAERTRALQSLRDGRARVCVATDVAARGIDLPDLGLVIHAELPKDPETLQHRSGRTGRAGRKGVSVLLVPMNRARSAERLLAAARVEASWGPPPTVEQVRAEDDRRIAAQAGTLVAEESEEADLAIARALLEAHAPEAVAAALVRQLRAPLPAPEELTEMPRPGQRPGPAPRERGAGPRGAERPEERGGERGGERDGGAWFRMNVGRRGNADPRWLLPFLCRRGHVTRQEIGRIQILDRETHFEVAPYAAARFAAAARQPDREDAHIRIEPVAAERDERPARHVGEERRRRPRG